MKCPKCAYLGFEHAERCRNCGYQFSLAAAPQDPELPLNSESDDQPPASPMSRMEPILAAEPSSDELPLFEPAAIDDEPLITRPSRPRPPLAVRRPTPDVHRLRSVAARAPSLDLAFDAPVGAPGPAPDAEPAIHDGAAPAAGLAARLLALLIDAGVLLAVDVAVVYFMLQICGIGLDDLAIVPRAPLAAFLLLQNGGYHVAFTVGGQTLGKMATGIRVVSSHRGEGVHTGRAIIRETTRLLLALPAGLGLLPAVFSNDHRGLHDRFAGTRVVRA